MPPRQFKRKRVFKKKRFIRGKTAGQVSMNTGLRRVKGMGMINDINPFPIHYNCKLVYNAKFTLTANHPLGQDFIGGLTEFRLNSPYAPSVTLGGSVNKSAYGFDQLMSVTGPYTRYRVRGVRYDIRWNDPDSDGLGCVVHIHREGDNFNIQTDINAVAGNPNTIIKRINDSGSQRRRLSQYMPMNVLYNLTKLQTNADSENTTGPFNGSPAFVPRLQLALVNLKDNDLTRRVSCDVRITYYTTLYGRYTLTP